MGRIRPPGRPRAGTGSKSKEKIQRKRKGNMSLSLAKTERAHKKVVQKFHATKREFMVNTFN